MWRALRHKVVACTKHCRHASKVTAGKTKQDWLLSKKSEQLRQVAIACGTVCSGTKQLLANGIENAIRSRDDVSALAEGDLSVVSIDMGIRNLAYCHLRTKVAPDTHVTSHDVTVDAWRRIDMTGGAESGAQPKSAVIKSKYQREKGVGQSVEEAKALPIKEDFSPSTYAERAHNFVSEILQKHHPTHVLIERQRFRTGGGPAVQEWTLRVGMFEFMLYATLHTLSAQGVHNANVLPVQPPMVNRYWLSQHSGQALEAKPTSMAMKRYKIEQVSRILEEGGTSQRQVDFTGQARDLRQEYFDKVKRVKGRLQTGTLPKLDDVSDCLLQALAWLEWQANRETLQKLKSGAEGTSSKTPSNEDEAFLPWRVNLK